jgi:hypothetical protein
VWLALGVLPKDARALGGVFNLYILYYFNGEVEKWIKT